MIHFVAGDSSREFKLNEIIDDIKKKKAGIEIKNYDGAFQEEYEIFMQEAYASSLFGGEKLLILKRSENVKSIDKDIAALAKYNLSGKTIIVDFDTDKSTLRKKQKENITQAAKFFEISSGNKNENQLTFIEEKLKISKKESFELLEIIGNDYFKIKSEIEKLQIYFNDNDYNFEEAKKIVSKTTEYNIFEMVEKFFNKNYEEVIKYLRATKEYMGFLYGVSKDSRTILKLLILEKELGLRFSNNYNSFNKNTYPAIKPHISMHPYAIFKKTQIIYKFDVNKMKEVIELCLKTECNIKMGRMSDSEAMEYFILKSSTLL